MSELNKGDVVKQVEAIHALEGMTKEIAPAWFNKLTDDYVGGRISNENAKKIALDKIKKGEY